MKKLVCCVTNDLSTDQRMARICGSLSAEGWDICLVGRRMPSSLPLPSKPYRQVRLNMLFSKGKLFYLEYNIRLLFYLLFHKADAIVAIDLDTIIPVYYASRFKRVPRIYDAHELFTELKEVVTRPRIRKAWLWVEKTFVPRFRDGYTVSASIVREFEKRYGVRYALVRNLPLKQPMPVAQVHQERFLLYQGAVNEGRCLEWLIPAMQWVDAPLRIYGEGNFSDQCRSLIRKYQLEDKVKMMGVVSPEELRQVSANAYAGINLVEPVGLNQIYSLANKFFDYIHAGIPQLCVDLPEYRAVNQQFEIALLISGTEPEIIASALNKLLHNEVFYADLRNNCIGAAEVLNWQQEEKTLVKLYHKILD
jgi:glycosyltransferase involved in cell wall biosynthesis